MAKRVEVDSFTNKEADRFWVVAAHPDNYYFASGSDSALYVFTLYKDRPPFAKHNHFLFLGMKKELHKVNLQTEAVEVLKDICTIANVQDNILQDNIE